MKKMFAILLAVVAIGLAIANNSKEKLAEASNEGAQMYQRNQERESFEARIRKQNALAQLKIQAELDAAATNQVAK
jgi:hypothetical protein